MSEERKKLVEVTGLKKYFPVKGNKLFEKKYVQAVESVSLSIYKGETLGLVGESGCGKSVTSLSLMQLVQRPQGQVVEGAIRFAGREGVYDIAKTPMQVMEHIL